MQSLADRILRTAGAHDLLPSGGRVLVALSGGSDSVALLHLLVGLAPRTRCPVVAVGHLNHGLRGAAADEDEAFCRRMAADLGLPTVVERVDVRRIARARKVSTEDAARTERYRFLERAADQVAATRIAVGHTRDDQAETFLLRLIRGAGPRGLAAIHPRHGRVVRPLLDVSRQDLREHLAVRGVAFREDESNLDLSIPRNRVRHELLPYLSAHLSPGIVEVLAREAAIAREDADLLDRLASDAAASMVRPAGEIVDVDVPALVTAPSAIAGRIAKLALERAVPGRFIGFEHVAALLDLARRDDGWHEGGIDLPGQRAVRLGDRIELRRPGAGEAAEVPLNKFCRPLSVPGEVRLHELGWTISAEPGPRPERGAAALSARGLEVAVDAVALGTAPAVRARRPGDRLRPLGLKGRKKVQDLFVDRKVPRAERDAVPVVVDGQDRIVWVVGHALAQDFRVTAETPAVIILRASRLGGQG